GSRVRYTRHQEKALPDETVNKPVVAAASAHQEGARVPGTADEGLVVEQVGVSQIPNRSAPLPADPSESMLKNKVALTTVGTVKPLRPACMSHGAGQTPAVPSKLQSDQDCFSPVSHSSKQLSPTSTSTSFPRRRPSLTVYEIRHPPTAPLAMQNP
ncbi:unnamed protein product, partial [Sphacelaria rigidula]